MGKQSSIRWLSLTLGALTSLASGQTIPPSESSAFPSPLCTHGDEPAIGLVAGSADLVSWSTIGDVAVVLEYESIYDVHSSLDPNQPIRSQPGAFFADTILSDLACFVDSSVYDFVLMYSLQELPGWIHAGPKGISCPAKNIGFLNSSYGSPSAFAAWSRLLLAPHMNSVELVIQNSPPDFGPLTAMHEMGHAWGVFWAQQSEGPASWDQGDPVAWLGSCCGHWSWNWDDSQMPGMMYSAPTAPHFNKFDLYAMGLMSYAEAEAAVYLIYEDPGNGPPGPTHSLRLDDLLYSLSLRGADYFEADGRRIPELDAAVAELSALIVVVKGEDEGLSPEQEAAITGLAAQLPQWWSNATDGRSSLVIALEPSNAIDFDGDGVADCDDNCLQTPNPAQDDLDRDGLGDDCDPCPHISFPSLWDLDHRGGFDLHDIQVFQNCFSGNLSMSPSCAFVDFSGGGKIDTTDYLPLAELMTGNCD